MIDICSEQGKVALRGDCEVVLLCTVFMAVVVSIIPVLL